MLYEISCDKFIKNNQPRGTIRFNDVLNVVKGHDSGTNSIGKSSFLLAVDFAFGGSAYAKDKKLIDRIKHHIINFAFKFDEKIMRFSRNTATPQQVNVCDDNYTVIKTISLDDFQKMLLALYKIELPNISFRQIVGRYFRVYGRNSSNETEPLASRSGEPPKDSLIALIKLFDGYTPIEKSYLAIKDREEHKNSILNAGKYNLVQLIKNKTAFQKNLEEIKSLSDELETLASYGRQDLLYMEPQQAEQAAEHKARYDLLTRRKKQLWAKYYKVKETAEKTRPTTAQDFNALLRYFPDSNLELLSNIENFHSKLTTILSDEFRQSMHEILTEINGISEELNRLDILLKELDVPKRIAENTLKTYAQKQNRINELNKQNKLYEEKRAIEDELKTLKSEYKQLFVDIFSTITSNINTLMEKLNTYIYGDDVVSPKLVVSKPTAYQFGTDVDGGTGTNFKNLILLDLASLDLTSLPVIVHDTILFKQIGQEPMAKIIELYNQCKKQVFISIDETTKYAPTAQKIITDNTVISLSANGDELFGSSWVKKTPTK